MKESIVKKRFFYSHKKNFCWDYKSEENMKNVMFWCVKIWV